MKKQLHKTKEELSPEAAIEELLTGRPLVDKKVSGTLDPDRLSQPRAPHWTSNDSGTVTIENTTFREFVDFEDCWFTGPVELMNVSFERGTNLLGMISRP